MPLPLSKTLFSPFYREESGGLEGQVPLPQIMRVIGGRAMAPTGKAEGGDGSGGTFLKQC